MERDAIRSALIVLGGALGLWALFNVGGGIGVWWGLSAVTEQVVLFLGVAVCIAATWALRRRV